MAKKAVTIGFIELRNRLRNRDFAPVYLIQGDEPWFIDQLVEDFEKYVLEEHERDFNLTTVYGLDSTFDQIISAAQRFPMMAEKQLILVKEAQDIDGWQREADRDYLMKYIESPQTTTVLVFAHKYKKLASNTKVYKAIDSKGIVFNSEKISDVQMPNWIVSRSKDLGINLAGASSRIISEYLGSDLNKVEHALEKLEFTMGKGVEILPEHIEKYIGISKEYNVYEFQRAISSRDFKRVAMIINYYEANPKNNNVNMIVGFLFSYLSKLLIYHSTPEKSNNSLFSAGIPWGGIPEYKVASSVYPVAKVIQGISDLRAMDRRLKGMFNSTTSDADELREFVFGFMN